MAAQTKHGITIRTRFDRAKLKALTAELAMIILITVQTVKAVLREIVFDHIGRNGFMVCGVLKLTVIGGATVLAPHFDDTVGKFIRIPKNRIFLAVYLAIPNVAQGVDRQGDLGHESDQHHQGQQQAERSFSKGVFCFCHLFSLPPFGGIVCFCFVWIACYFSASSRLCHCHGRPGPEVWRAWPGPGG